VYRDFSPINSVQPCENSFVPIRRASCQPSASLEGFYQALAASSDSVSSSIGRQMLSLLPLLSDICVAFNVWGLTSHAHLWLLPSDDPSAPWLVAVMAFPGQGYQIRYKMTEADAPWPEAFVEGTAPDEAAACGLILTAIKRSGGWR
jgi:hypothetical protein